MKGFCGWRMTECCYKRMTKQIFTGSSDDGYIAASLESILAAMKKKYWEFDGVHEWY